MRQPLRRRRAKAKEDQPRPASTSAAGSGEAGPTDPVAPATSTPTATGPARPEPPTPDRGIDDTHDATATAAKQAAYAAWAEGMKEKRKAKLASLQADPDEAAARGPSPYWDTAALFAQPDEDTPTDPALMATPDLLAVLELPADATTADLQPAFRRLAKEHHPDRWYDSSASVRLEHETRMALITEAHRELRRRNL